MSADTRPIEPARFAAALKELSVGMLHLKVLEIRNSIAHLQYSNDQLKPFAEGSATAISDSNDATSTAAAEPDQDCIDAIKENEGVIDRMIERIALARAEVEERGMSWTEFQSKDEAEAKAAAATAAAEQNAPATNGTAVNGEQPRHSAWTDGTFQTGTISNGQVQLDGEAGHRTGGTLNDEQLRAAMEEQLRQMGTDEAEDDGGMHL